MTCPICEREVIGRGAQHCRRMWGERLHLQCYAAAVRVRDTMRVPSLAVDWWRELKRAIEEAK